MCRSALCVSEVAAIGILNHVCRSSTSRPDHLGTPTTCRSRKSEAAEQLPAAHNMQNNHGSMHCAHSDTNAPDIMMQETRTTLPQPAADLGVTCNMDQAHSQRQSMQDKRTRSTASNSHSLHYKLGWDSLFSALRKCVFRAVIYTLLLPNVTG